MNLFKEKNIRFALYIPVCIMAWIERNSPTDLDIYLEASKHYTQGINPFDEFYHQWYHFYYSQFFALVIFPLVQLPTALAHMIWMLFNYFLAEQCFFILKKQTQAIPVHHTVSFAIVVILSSMRFVYENLHYGQVSILILWLCLKALDAIENKRELSAGGWLAIGINIKILPVALLPWLVLRKKWKALVFCVTVFFLLASAPALYAGKDSWLAMGRARWDLINPLQTQHIKDMAEDSFHSITAFLSVYLTENEDYHGMERSLMRLDDKGLAVCILLARLIFAASMILYMFRTGGFAGKKNSDAQEWYFALLLIPLSFPHQQHYAFVFIIPAFSMQVAAFFTSLSTHPSASKRRGLLLFIPAIVWSLKLLIGEFNPLYEYYKILTWSALWLWILVFSGFFLTGERIGQQRLNRNLRI